MNAQAAKIIIMRHGQAMHNIKEVYNSDPHHANYEPMDLTKEGIEQVEDTCKQLLDLGFNKNNCIAYVSPLERTKQTAEILVSCGILMPESITFDERLIEIQVGDKEGKSYHDFPEHHWDHSHATVYHGETIQQVIKRVKQIVKEVQHIQDKYVILVTHGTPAFELIAAYKGEGIVLPTAGFYILDI